MADTTKYLFNGNEYNKRRMVLAVVRQYLKDTEGVYEDIVEAFPNQIQGSVGTTISEEQLSKKLQNSEDSKRRFFMDFPLTDKNGEKFYVSGEWGRGNIEQFIHRARELGYTIKNKEFHLRFEAYKKAPNAEWMSGYRKECQAYENYQGKQENDIDEKFLINLWLNPQNWVSSVKPAFLSKNEFKNIVDQLPSITLEILNDPNPTMLGKVIQWAEHAVNEGRLKSAKRAVIHRVFSTANPKQYSTILSDNNLNKLIGELNRRYGMKISNSGNWADKNIALMKAIKAEGLEDEDIYLVNTFAWQLYQKYVESLDPDPIDVDKTNGGGRGEQTRSITMVPLNTILYGPPGTGKTYHTVDHALKIIDQKYYEENRHNRDQLKQRFDEYVEKGRIGFVTFHQSFSYEDFVEGIRADTDDSGAISYSVQDGIFKELCERAITDDDSLGIDAAIGKLIEYLEDNTLTLETATGKRFTVTYRGLKTFRIHPQDSANSGVYPASISNIKKAFRGVNKKDIYNPSYVYSILEHLKSNYHLGEERNFRKEEPVVLIIDEINRGNTANIFGELITLIEPSKRAGASEALEVMLPYSKEKFSVPENLFILGTMNTADRSLALLDTALRRRFKFQEMMPDSSLLDGIVVLGIDVKLMFETMNKRISVLYDREHMIGHSFFLPLKKDNSFKKLTEILQGDILPLLEEYFFEDWEKIARVLGDPGKSEALKMIQPMISEKEMEALFYGDDDGNFGPQYQRNGAALNNPQSFIGIYQTVE